MLYAAGPEAPVAAAVGPDHLADALALVVDVRAYVTVATFPLEDSLALLLVVGVFAFIGVAALFGHFFLPLSMAVFKSTFELPRIRAAIDPLILTKTLRLARQVLPHINVAILEEVGAVAVAQAPVPLAFILVAVAPDVHPVALGLRVEPLADVALAVDALPHAVACFGPRFPLSIVHLSRLPSVDAFAVGAAVVVLTLVGVSISEQLKPTPVSLISNPLPLINATILIDLHTKSLPQKPPLLPLDQQPPIYSVLILLNSKRLILPKLYKIELIRKHFIFFYRITFILKLQIFFRNSLLLILFSDQIEATFGHFCLHFLAPLRREEGATSAATAQLAGLEVGFLGVRCFCL